MRGSGSGVAQWVALLLLSGFTHRVWARCFQASFQCGLFFLQFFLFNSQCIDRLCPLCPVLPFDFGADGFPHRFCRHESPMATFVPAHSCNSLLWSVVFRLFRHASMLLFIVSRLFPSNHLRFRIGTRPFLVRYHGIVPPCTCREASTRSIVDRGGMPQG